MKCYITTYYKYNNYGTRLQNYALKKCLEKHGLEVITLGKKSIKDNISFLIKRLLIYFPFSSKKIKWKNDVEKSKVFNEFNKKLNIKLVSKKELFNTNYNNSFGISGSDQIWSPIHLKNNKQDIDLFFLKFLKKEKRYSYAASFGVKEISDECEKIYHDNLKDYRIISVREQEGKKIIKNTLGIDAEIMPDPVFLLSKEEWIEYLNLNINKEKKYILLYFLGDINDEQKGEIIEFSKANECAIISIAGNSYTKEDILPNPKEFLELILNSEAIFTDSFHASSFSIIFEKKFFVYKRRDVKQFSRIENLLKKYNKQNAYTKERIIDYEVLSNKRELEEEKEKGSLFIKNIINDNSEE